MVNGYNVIKAIGKDRDGNEVVAWYSPEIKYKDGPHNIANLPGLIMQVEIITPYFKTIFKLSELEILKENLKITLPSKGRIMTFQEMRNDMDASSKSSNQGVEK